MRGEVRGAWKAAEASHLVVEHVAVDVIRVVRAVVVRLERQQAWHVHRQSDEGVLLDRRHEDTPQAGLGVGGYPSVGAPRQVGAGQQLHAHRLGEAVDVLPN